MKKIYEVLNKAGDILSMVFFSIVSSIIFGGYAIVFLLCAFLTVFTFVGIPILIFFLFFYVIIEGALRIPGIF